MEILMIERELNGRKLRIYDNGKIESFHPNKWNKLTSKPIIKKSGYKQIQVTINQKLYIASRIIFWAFNPDFDINNSKICIDHINHDSTDNRLSNLRVVTIQQNSFNTNAKGYQKRNNKWRAYIRLNGELKHLGTYATEDEARKSYLLAKEKYHVI